ncbi:MAG TPA: peptidase M1 [Cryomorphaceae bacterium]|nr:peptidase M1 [Owenweeksia sp.]HAD98641.1 peptidase M1 [Cryomorphaceae bacterium]HBF21421.1 peptidase M1 [Cryomorphaceae bacterium]|tara:strand:+ start:23214 stop:25028 length:1815 start_codon:yes stop_codon:yes gene_type:complete
MKKLILAVMPLALFAHHPATYWQQQVKYTMNIDFDVETHRFVGTQELVYTNNSPDTLEQVFYHLYFNAFQPGSMMDERSRDLPDPDHRIGDRISKLKEDEIGYHQITSLTQDGATTQYTVHATALQVQLAQPLAPGASTTFKMEFNSQVPVQIRRSGRNNAEGVDYTMTQWYPKMAVYDEDGWHPDPYVAREFYGEYGVFDVTINIDYNYKLGGTGVLMSPEVWQKTGETDGVSSYELVPNKKSKRTWKFHAENVHDFAWAADPEYIRTSTAGPGGMEINFFYLPGSWKDNWVKLPPYTVSFFRLMNEKFGTYAYPQFSVIQGGDGGMEYPMCTMLKGTGKLDGLVGVMVHESAHNWFYGMLGTNENQYPWMDEGFTSFAEEEVLNVLMEKNEENPHKGAYRNYFFLVQQNEVEPMSTPADYFDHNRTYGISSYSRGQMFLAQLRYIIGDETFNKGMLKYYEVWRFKHPDPQDFLRVMEEVSGIQLDWYLNFWMNTSKTIDYAIEGVENDGRLHTMVSLKREGSMPMPLVLEVKLKSGGTRYYQVPLLSMYGSRNDMPALQEWPWTNPVHKVRLEIPFRDIEEITIDPLEFMADVKRENNDWKE